MDDIIKLRRQLHQNPELSDEEADTAGIIKRYFESLNPDHCLEGLGGHGLAFVFSGKTPGPTVMLRCELDALPIQEQCNTDYCSKKKGVAHQCGHDGHMAVLAAVGKKMSKERPERGRVVLLFQPSEENARGAAAVIRDPRFKEIEPDFAFAMHNLPGFPLGQVILRYGPFCSASRGMVIRLSGATAHAAQPETGSSPAIPMCHIIRRLSEWPEDEARSFGNAIVTVVGARLGEKAFGTAPGHAEIWVTPRSETDDGMEKLLDHADRLVRRQAAAYGLEYDTAFTDIFPATVNARRAVERVLRAAPPLAVHEMDRPFRWSEDFAHIAALTEGALFGMGAGVDVPHLHNPDYNFPEALIPLGASLFVRIVRDCLA